MDAIDSNTNAQGYAIPLATLEADVASRANGKSVAWPGFGAIAVPTAPADRWDLNGGEYVTAVAKDTPAVQTGLGALLSQMPRGTC